MLLLNATDINKAWCNWRETFLSIMGGSISQVTLPSNRINCPWLSKELTGNFSDYKRKRNKVVSQLRLAKKTFFHKINFTCLVLKISESTANPFISTQAQAFQCSQTQPLAKQQLTVKKKLIFLIMPQWVEPPEAYGSRFVYVNVCLSVGRISRPSMKTKC